MEPLDLAKQLFNETWTIIDQENRSTAETILMLHKAHTSCNLWQTAANPANNDCGEWLVVHAYALSGDIIRMKESYALGQQAGTASEDDEDRASVRTELNTLNAAK